MSRLSSILLIAVALLITVTSCRKPMVHGHGPQKSEDRQLSGSFSHIEIQAPVDATIRVVPGAAPAINLNGFANVLPYIKLKVENDVLKIYVDNEVHIHSKKKTVATITLPSLAGLEIAGSSDAAIAGNVTGNELKIDLAGSASITIDSLNVTLLDVDMAGASDITINSGSTPTTSYDIAGSGNINAFNLLTKDTEIEISGSGKAEVNATSKLDVSVGGSGNVLYKGNPVITKDIAGSGSIEAAN